MAGEGTATSTRGANQQATDQRGTDQRGTDQRGLAVKAGGKRLGTTQQLQTKPPAPVSGITTADYVDTFREVKYNLNESPDGRNLSKTLHVFYENNTQIDIKIDSIGDEWTVPFSGDDEFFYVGDGGRVFPRRLARATVPNLWEMKRRALIAMSEYNQLLIHMSFVACSFVFPPPTAGLSRLFHLKPQTGP